MKKINCLITGITGMVGSHLLDYLMKETNWDIYGMCRWRSPLNNIQEHLGSDRLHLIDGDLIDSVSVSKVVEKSMPQYVFHLAAQSYPKVSFDSPLSTFDVNIDGTLRLLDAIKNTNKEAIVHICSSSEVFGRVSKEKLPINEECTFHPASPYAISKCGTDLVGRYYAEAFGINTQITRMFTHTGPRRGDVFAESSFAKQIAMIELGLIEPVVRVGNLNSLRTIADVRDAVRAYYLLVTKNPVHGAYYNIGGNKILKIGEILEYLIGISTKKGIKIEIDQSRLRPIDADLQVPDPSKFINHTGWQPEILFEKTMSDLLDYWRVEVSNRRDVRIVR